MIGKKASHISSLRVSSSLVKMVKKESSPARGIPVFLISRKVRRAQHMKTKAKFPESQFSPPGTAPTKWRTLHDLLYGVASTPYCTGLNVLFSFAPPLIPTISLFLVFLPFTTPLSPDLPYHPPPPPTSPLPGLITPTDPSLSFLI